MYTSRGAVATHTARAGWSGNAIRDSILRPPSSKCTARTPRRSWDYPSTVFSKAADNKRPEPTPSSVWLSRPLPATLHMSALWVSRRHFRAPPNGACHQDLHASRGRADRNGLRCPDTWLVLRGESTLWRKFARDKQLQSGAHRDKVEFSGVQTDLGRGACFGFTFRSASHTARVSKLQSYSPRQSNTAGAAQAPRLLGPVVPLEDGVPLAQFARRAPVASVNWLWQSLGPPQPVRFCVFEHFPTCSLTYRLQSHHRTFELASGLPCCRIGRLFASVKVCSRGSGSVHRLPGSP